jgi:hypothetical protein
VVRDNPAADNPRPVGRCRKLPGCNRLQRAVRCFC